MPQGRDILGVQARIKCKFCTEVFETFEDLQFHSQSTHQAEFHKVTQWLENSVDPKLRAIKQVADDGLAGKYAGSDDSGAIRREGDNWINLDHASKLVHNRGMSITTDLEALID